MAACPAGGAASYRACCTASIAASVFSVLISKHSSMDAVEGWL
jgi:hypothetical protein